MNEFIGLHGAAFLAPVLFAQILITYFLLFFTVSISALTPVPWVPKSIPFAPWWKRSTAQKLAHGACRTIAALAYIGVMAGAAFSLAGISMSEVAGETQNGSGLNSLGVTLRTSLGTMALFHMLGVMWRASLMFIEMLEWREEQRRDPPEAEKVES